MTTIAIVYFSAFGHTHKLATTLAEAITQAEGEPQLIRINDNGDISDHDWQALADADAIIYGSPTYMGGPAWQFKKIADASTKPWAKQLWKDKIAGGFTISAATNGDKAGVINYFMTLSQQHGQIWVGTGLHPANQKQHSPVDMNWSGGFAGIMAIARADASVDEISEGDLKVAAAYGARITALSQKLSGNA